MFIYNHSYYYGVAMVTDLLQLELCVEWADNGGHYAAQVAMIQTEPATIINTTLQHIQTSTQVLFITSCVPKKNRKLS